MDLLDVPLSPDNLFSDLLGDLDVPVNATDLTDFPDDAIAASLAAFSGRDDDGDLELQALLSDRQSTRSPGMGTFMRSSFSMNDLTVLQHQHMPVGPSWNHKLVSVKPKLHTVPEGGPSNGGPLNLMPLPAQLALSCEPHSNGHHLFGAHMGMELQGSSHQTQHHGLPGLDPSLDDYVDFDSDMPGGMHKQLPSTGTLSQQLQMTHVTSDHQLAGMEASMASAQGGMRAHQGMNPHSIFPAGSQGTMQQQAPQQGQEQHIAPGSQSVKRSATGLPLRKSQSAVELGSWRSFSGGLEEVWDLDVPGDAKALKLSPEERVQRIQRYREKRLQRNFNRAVKYQCRKSLADSRPRVRGRFARNGDMGMVLPHEAKKLQRDGGGSSSQDHSTDQSSGQTSSGGAPSQMGPAATPVSSYSLMQVSPLHPGAAPGLARLGSSPSAAMFGSAAGRTCSLPAMPPTPMSLHPAASSGLPGVNMIGATPLPMLPGPAALPPGGVVAPPPPSVGVMPPPSLLPNSFPPMPPVIGPSTGGIFGAPPPGFSSVPPAPAFAPPGQSIFTGQTIFSGSSLKLQPASGTASAHPSMSPPLHAASPTASDSHSHSQSVGLSIGDLSVGHSL